MLNKLLGELGSFILGSCWKTCWANFMTSTIEWLTNTFQHRRHIKSSSSMSNEVQDWALHISNHSQFNHIRTVWVCLNKWALTSICTSQKRPWNHRNPWGFGAGATTQLSTLTSWLQLGLTNDATSTMLRVHSSAGHLVRAWTRQKEPAASLSLLVPKNLHTPVS